MHEHQSPALVVALLRRPSDEARLLRDGTYHVPLATAGKVIGASMIAWYVPGWHPDTPHTVRYRATILDGSLVTRAAYIPEEPTHPRAAAPYWVVRVAEVSLLDPPLPSSRWRRVGVHRFDLSAWERSTDLGQVRQMRQRLPAAPAQWEW